jgi:hypothetical protein
MNPKIIEIFCFILALSKELDFLENALHEIWNLDPYKNDHIRSMNLIKIRINKIKFIIGTSF